MTKIKLLLIPALFAVLAFSSCKVCKDCAAYTGEDSNGNPEYSNEKVEKCGDELKDAEDEMTDPIIGTTHHAWDCDL